jgi:hypothetical protein
MEATLGKPYTGRRYPCRLRGWRRRWTSLYPNERYYFRKSEGARCYPRHILYLNVEPADSVLNGVVYLLDESDLPGLDEREAVYKREIVKLEGLDPGLDALTVYTYVGIPPYILTGVPVVEDAAIRASYLRIIEEALNELGPAFREEYLRSTDPTPNVVIDDQAETE